MPISWKKTALGLVILTIAYNVAEAIASIFFGAETDSISLMGFGLDSIIEVSAASLLLWHLLKNFSGMSECLLEETEKSVRRFIGITFVALAIYVCAQSGYDLWMCSQPQASWIGMIIAALSLVIMPVLAYWKIKAAKKINSEALRLEAKETIACSYLSFVLLMGLGLNATLQWWWADPVAALLMVPWLIKEGVEGIKGEACCDN